MSKYPNLNQYDHPSIENILTLINKHYDKYFNLNALNAYPQGDYFEWVIQCLDCAKENQYGDDILNNKTFLNQTCYLFAKNFNISEERTHKQLSFLRENILSFNLFISYKSKLSSNNLLRLVRFLAKSPTATPLLSTILLSVSKFSSKHRSAYCKAIIKAGHSLLATKQGYRLFEHLIQESLKPQKDLARIWNAVTEKNKDLKDTLVEALLHESVDVISFVLGYSSEDLKHDGENLAIALKGIPTGTDNRINQITFFVDINKQQTISLEDSMVCYNFITAMKISDKDKQLELIPLILDNLSHLKDFTDHTPLLSYGELLQLMQFDPIVPYYTLIEDTKQSLLPLILASSQDLDEQETRKNYFLDVIQATYSLLKTNKGYSLLKNLLTLSINNWHKSLLTIWRNLAVNVDKLPPFSLCQIIAEEPCNETINFVFTYSSQDLENYGDKLALALQNINQDKPDRFERIGLFISANKLEQISLEHSEVCYQFLIEFGIIDKSEQLRLLPLVRKNLPYLTLFSYPLTLEILEQLLTFDSTKKEAILPRLLSNIRVFSSENRGAYCDVVIATSNSLLTTSKGYSLFERLLQEYPLDQEEKLIKVWNNFLEKATYLKDTLLKTLTMDESCLVDILDFILDQSPEDLQQYGENIEIALKGSPAIRNGQFNYQRLDQIIIFVDTNKRQKISLEDSDVCVRFLHKLEPFNNGANERSKFFSLFLKNLKHLTLFEKAYQANCDRTNLERLLTFDSVERERILPLFLPSIEKYYFGNRNAYCNAVIDASKSDHARYLCLLLQSYRSFPSAFVQQFSKALKTRDPKIDKNAFINKIVAIWNKSTQFARYPELATSLLYSNIVPQSLSINGEKEIENTDYFLAFMKERIDGKQQLINFEAPIEQRLTLLLALKNETLVCEEDEVWKWSKKDNSEAIDRCITEYLDQSRQILSENEREQDLSLDQYKEIICLAKELEVFAPTSAPIDQPTTLVTALQAQLSRYEIDTNWSRSALRNQELATFQNKLTGFIFDQKKDSTHFEQLLDLIREQKKQVASEDAALNKTRSSWFKHNRKGYSRYLDTLNQMRDLIMKEWLGKNEAIPHLPKYLPTIEEDMSDAKQQLIEGVKNSISELETGFSLNALFRKDLLSDLKTFLTALNNKNIATLKTINQYETKLPAHFKPLMKEFAFQLELYETLQAQATVIPTLVLN